MEASDAISSMRYKNADKIDEFIHFVMDNSNDGLLAVNIAIWLILNEYDWNALLYDIHCDINGKFAPDQSNLYLFLKQYNRQLFEQIYTEYLDDIRALYHYDVKQKNAKIDRICICGTHLVQITVTERIKKYFGDDWKQMKKEIICDQCNKMYYNDDIIFYCPNKSEKHLNGYDICNLCAIQYKHSQSNQKRLLLQSMGYSVAEAGNALYETNDKLFSAIHYLLRKEQIKINKENQIDTFYDTDNEHINPLIHSENMYNKQYQENDDTQDEQNENNDTESKSSDSTKEEQTCESCDIQSCVHLDSALFVLKNMDKEIDIMIAVDAFLHLIEFHNDDNDFLFIVTNLMLCDFNQCDVFKRHYRDRNNAFTKEPNVRDQIIDKFHCYYLHSQDLGHRLYTNIETQNDDNNQSVINQKLQMVFNQKCKAQKYIYRHYKTQIQKFNQIKHNFTAFDTNVPYYSFGVEYKYISCDMEYKQEDDVERIKPLLVKGSIFKSLKDELTLNNMSRMTMEQFNNEY
eukprot:160153_1